VKRTSIVAAGLLASIVAVAAGQTAPKQAGAAAAPKKVLCGTQIVIRDDGITALPQVPAQCSPGNKVRWVFWNFEDKVHEVAIVFKENKDCQGGRKYPTKLDKHVKTLTPGDVHVVAGDIDAVKGPCPASPATPNAATPYLGNYTYDVVVDGKTVSVAKAVLELQIVR
jgi:hypothetical protein